MSDTKNERSWADDLAAMHDRVIELEAENKKLRGLLSGDIDMKESQDTREMWRLSAVRYADKVLAENKRLREGLKRAQYSWTWSGMDRDSGTMRCIGCDEWIPCSTHEAVYPKCKPDCWLNALIGEKA